jgi:transposase InsO family protein
LQRSSPPVNGGNGGPGSSETECRGAEIVWPAESTIAGVLKQAGLTHRRRPRLRTPPYAQAFAVVDGPNQTWCTDLGWFRTGDGVRRDPLTITDAHSRYLFRCQITAKTDTILVAAIFGARSGNTGYRWSSITITDTLCQPRAGRAEPTIHGVGEAGNPAGAIARGIPAR